MKLILIVSLCLTASACTTMGRINTINMGMSKADVIDKMGDPDSTRAEGNAEILIYNLSEEALPIINKMRGEYWVVLTEGKVNKFGRMGDSSGNASAMATRSAMMNGWNAGINSVPREQKCRTDYIGDTAYTSCH
jgi:hypothetical protein